MDNHTYAAYIHELCQDAAWQIYGRTPPNERYAAATTDLLFGTIAHESGMFQHTRQMGFSWVSDKGAWGLCQTELGSVTDSMALLARNPALAKRVAVFASGGDKDASLDAIMAMHPRTVLRLLPLSDPLAVAFCRLHYFRDPHPIPSDRASQDAMYKRVYNSILGSAKPGDFTRALVAAKAMLA